MNTNAVSDVFRAGDEVVLAEGTYQGTPGLFLRLRPDTAWADIEERNGAVRNHPVEWLAHAAPLEPAPAVMKPRLTQH